MPEPPDRQTRSPIVGLVTHVDPPIHGQAVMAATLVERAKDWSGPRLVVVNTAYALERESLVTFSVRKLALMARYLVSTVVAMRRARADLVIVTPSFYAGPFLKDAVMVCALRLLSGARVIAWVNMDPARLDFERRPWWYRRVATFALARVDSWVASASSLLDQWPDFIPRGRRFAIAYGIPAAPAAARTDPAEGGALRVCFISSLDESKGWTDLLEAAEEICATNATVVFDFYGDVGVGWTRSEVVERFRSCPFGERIRWHDVVRGEAKWSSLASSDLFCLPSHTEQLPIVVLEAMSAALPIIATRVGAMEEAVVEGQGGWLVLPRRPAELVAALQDALSDRARLRTFGEFNASRQRSEFSIERFGLEWERLLLRLAARS
jgi:glycosyltransferase involved in cell wall biosynthesis